MDTLHKRQTQSILTQGITLCLVSLAMFFIELTLMGMEAALQQAPHLVITATLYFALSYGCHAVFIWLMKQEGKRAIAFYMAEKLVRLLFTAILLLVYALNEPRNLLAFAMNLIALHLASSIASITFYVKVEQNIRKKQ